MLQMAIGIQVLEYRFFEVILFRSCIFLCLAGAQSIGGVPSTHAAQNIRKQVEVLKEENNMLKLKVDILLNLVAESIAELSPSVKK